MSIYLGLRCTFTRSVARLLSGSAKTSPSIPKNRLDCSVTEDGKKIKLSIGDNELERRYHGVWLRHNCRCPQCYSSSTDQNVVAHKNLIGLKVDKAWTDSTGNQVHVEWTSDAGPHSCSFDVDWLKKHDYTSPGIHEQRTRSEEPTVADNLPVSDYHEAIASKEGYYKWMRQINLYGVTLMKNVPVADKLLVEFTNQIADPQDQPFLKVFEVRSVPNASNRAYTTRDLMLHTDQGFLEQVPGIQFFYCIRFDDCVEGGESTVVDTVPVIEELRQKHPKHFKVLSRVPYTATMEHDSLDGQNKKISLRHSTPHIQLDSNGKLIGISWCPQVHAPLFAKEKDVEDYYEAFTTLSSMFENSPRKMVHRLRPGEAIITNNRRVLHGREAFVLNGGERHLQGFYLASDYFRSRLAVLAKELGKDEPMKHFLNNSHFA